MYSDERRLRDWIGDIVDNVDRIQTYTKGISLEALSANEMARDACERCLERIAEAAVRIGPERLARIAPETVLHQLRGFANRLRHEYDRIDGRLLWDVIERDLPPLRAACAAALASPGEENTD